MHINCHDMVNEEVTPRCRKKYFLIRIFPFIVFLYDLAVRRNVLVLGGFCNFPLYSVESAVYRKYLVLEQTDKKIQMFSSKDLGFKS